MEDELICRNALASGNELDPINDREPWANALRLMNLDTEPTPYQQLRTIVDHLRTEFIFDRTVETKTKSRNLIEEFLRSRRGGDHLFATTAAMTVRQFGLESRLVTGFYVRPSAFDITAGHASVLPDDVHVWVEIKLDDGRWFEIEPTPGYAQPIYTPSLWLVTKRFAAAHWIHGLGMVAIGLFAWMISALTCDSFATLLMRQFSEVRRRLIERR